MPVRLRRSGVLYGRAVPQDESVPVLDHGSPLPLYRQLADWAGRRIISGPWQPPYRFPAERDLADMWGVSYWTIRRMMQELRERGLVVSTQGRGTFSQRPRGR
jgi:GntR family transcriptional regulator